MTVAPVTGEGCGDAPLSVPDRGWGAGVGERLGQVQVQSDIGARQDLAALLLCELGLQALCGLGPQWRIDHRTRCRDASALDKFQDCIDDAFFDGEIIRASDPVARLGVGQWRRRANHRGGAESDAIGVSIGLAPNRRATI